MRYRPLRLPVITTLMALSGCATLERDAFTASAGASISEHSAITPLGELALAGTLVEMRASLPGGFYGLLQLRNERGEGRQGSATGGIITDNDYVRQVTELGWDFGLPFGFTGGVGVNFVQADLDVEIVVDDAPLKVAVNREDYGGRLRLARTGDWLSLATDLEVSPVEEAIAGIFELESGRRFGPWSLAVRYGQFPEITQAAVLLRYRYGTAPPVRYKPAEAGAKPEDAGQLQLDERLDARPTPDAQTPDPSRPPWLYERPQAPEIDYKVKTLPDGRPEWFADEPQD